jgi:carbon-monoxide dehydrogenase medium subunit
VLAALDARIELMSQRGTRELPLNDFQRGSYETALEPGELLSAILLPPLPPGMRGQYIKFTTGSSEERPCAGVAAMAQIDNGICRELRLAVGAVSPRPARIAAAELAINRSLTSEVIKQIAAEAAHVVDPINDLRGPADYKRHLVAVLVRRAINKVADNTTETNS